MKRTKTTEQTKVDLNSDNLPDKIKVTDIKTFNKAFKSTAVANLIKECEEFDQGLVDSSEFVKARSTIQCPLCSNTAGVGYAIDFEIKDKDGNGIKVCKDCYQKKRDNEMQDAMNAKWKVLYDKLNKISKGYEFIHDYGFNNEPRIIKTVFLANKERIIFRIYRDDIYSGSIWNSRVVKHALRISSDYGMCLDANRLQKDFNGNKVEESLDNKINNLVDTENARIERRTKNAKMKNELVNMIKKDLGISDDDFSDYWTGRQYTSRSASSNVKKIRLGKFDILASKYGDDKKVSYSIKSTGRSFTAVQLKKLLAFIDKL